VSRIFAVPASSVAAATHRSGANRNAPRPIEPAANVQPQRRPPLQPQPPAAAGKRVGEQRSRRFARGGATLMTTPSPRVLLRRSRPRRFIATNRKRWSRRRPTSGIFWRSFIMASGCTQRWDIARPRSLRRPSRPSRRRRAHRRGWAMPSQWAMPCEFEA